MKILNREKKLSATGTQTTQFYCVHVYLHCLSTLGCDFIIQDTVPLKSFSTENLARIWHGTNHFDPDLCI